MSLPRLDIYALTHNAAKWPLPGKALLGCALAAVVLAVGDLAYLSPARERLQQAEAQEVALQQQIAQKSVLSAGLEAHTQQFERLQAEVDAWVQQFPDRSHMPGLLEDIGRSALANGLLIESVTPLDEQLRPFYSEQPVQIGVTGAYHDLATFLGALGDLSQFATVHDLTLRRDGSSLRLDVLARTYWHAQQDGARVQAVVQRPPFVYDGAGLRDPFLQLAVQVDHSPGRPAPAPDLTRPRGVLESLAVDQFKMVGTLSRGMQTFALLRSASTVYRLAIGDYLGPDHGRVTAIHDGHIELVELFPDERGAWLERSRTLVLNVNS